MYLFNQKDAPLEERGSEDAEDEGDAEEGNGQYVTTHKLLQDSHGYPAVKPPWGTLSATNLNAGEVEWKVPLGTYPELAEEGRPPTGMPSMGGPIATAGGLVFIAGTEDKKRVQKTSDFTLDGKGTAAQWAKADWVPIAQRATTERMSRNPAPAPAQSDRKPPRRTESIKKRARSPEWTSSRRKGRGRPT